MAFCSHDFGIRKFRFTGCKLFVPEPEPEPAAKDPLVAVVSLLLPMNMEDIPEGSLARTEFEAAFVLDLARVAVGVGEPRLRGRRAHHEVEAEHATDVVGAARAPRVRTCTHIVGTLSLPFRGYTVLNQKTIIQCLER